jgi:hypothetical protein
VRIIRCYGVRDEGLPQSSSKSPSSTRICTRGSPPAHTGSLIASGAFRAQTYGKIQVNNLKEWLLKVRDLCKEHGRAEIGDQMIGPLLANAPADEDGTWPSRQVREAMEWMSSDEVGRGFHVAARNARGAQWRGDGGDQERELSAKNRAWARKVAYVFPCE